jgi:ABC-2 type transport system permease protein
MFTTLRYTLIRFRGQILGWGLGLAALGLMIVPFYDVFVEQQGQFLQMLESYPPEILAFFGGDAESMATPEGYLGMYGFSMLPVIIGIFAVAAGSGLLASDEESGRLDLIVAHPASRAAIYWGRLLGLVGATLAVIFLGWLGFVVTLGESALDVGAWQMAVAFLPVLAQALIYGSLALLFSMLLPARRQAAMLAGLVMVSGYVLTSMSGLAENLSTAARILPYEYFQGGEALRGLDLAAFFGIVGASALMALLSWWLFQRKDIRVGGEGGWRLPSILRRGARSEA